jgi:glucose-6-phosphate isomerase
VGSVNHDNVAQFMALLQFLPVYSGWLRDVDPFNQPDVEKSKNLGFKERFKNE